jgi:hypothetical protein
MKAWSFDTPFHTVTVIALLSLSFVLLAFRDFQISWYLLVRRYAGQYRGPG